MVVSVQHGRPAPHGADQRRALTNHRQADGVQAGDGSLPHLAAAEGGKPVAESGGRCHLPGWDRDYREPRSPRRLTPPSPKSPHSSPTQGVSYSPSARVSTQSVLT